MIIVLAGKRLSSDGRFEIQLSASASSTSGDRATPEEEAEIIADGSPEKWGKECYQIAAEVYNTTPEDSKLSYDYIAKWTPVIEEQFLRGGLRLADLLNSIFDPHYAGANNIIKKN